MGEVNDRGGGSIVRGGDQNFHFDNILLLWKMMKVKISLAYFGARVEKLIIRVKKERKEER